MAGMVENCSNSNLSEFVTIGVASVRLTERDHSRSSSTLVHAIINMRTTLPQLFTGGLEAHVAMHGNSERLAFSRVIFISKTDA